MYQNVFHTSMSRAAEYYQHMNIKKIVGLTRGGLPLAVKLSHALQVPMETLDWQTRDGSNKDVAKLQSLLFEQGLLFVDDICDSGLTIEQIKNYAPNSQWYVLVDKQCKDSTIKGALQMKDDHRWIVFPWE